MPTKEQYSRVFNALLGIDVDWTKLSKEELSQLSVVFNNPVILLEKLGVKGQYKTRVARETILDAGISLVQEWEGPLVKIARKILGAEEKVEEKSLESIEK